MDALEKRLHISDHAAARRSEFRRCDRNPLSDPQLILSVANCARGLKRLSKQLYRVLTQARTIGAQEDKSSLVTVVAKLGI